MNCYSLLLILSLFVTYYESCGKIPGVDLTQMVLIEATKYLNNL